jgi:hypothetical protein
MKVVVFVGVPSRGLMKEEYQKWKQILHAAYLHFCFKK